MNDNHVIPDEGVGRVVEILSAMADGDIGRAVRRAPADDNDPIYQELRARVEAENGAALVDLGPIAEKPQELAPLMGGPAAGQIVARVVVDLIAIPEDGHEELDVNVYPPYVAADRVDDLPPDAIIAWARAGLQNWEEAVKQERGITPDAVSVASATPF